MNPFQFSHSFSLFLSVFEGKIGVGMGCKCVRTQNYNVLIQVNAIGTLFKCGPFEGFKCLDQTCGAHLRLGGLAFTFHSFMGCCWVPRAEL